MPPITVDLVVHSARPAHPSREKRVTPYLRGIWHTRFFWTSLVWMDLRTRYHGTILGMGWSLLHPLAMTAGLWCLDRLSPRLYRDLATLGTRLAAGLADAAREAVIPLQVNAHGSLLTPFFTDRPVRDYASATTANTDRYARFFRGMIVRGIYPPPSQFEAWFLSAAHTRKDVDRTVAAARAAMKEVSAATKARKHESE